MTDFNCQLIKDAAEVGATVAGPAADAVDREARFPHEAVAAFRDRGMLTAMIPAELGGGGVGMGEINEAVHLLAQHCASAALVFAMHSIEISTLKRYGTTEALIDFQRSLPERQLLFANANSEIGVGGDVARSICAVETTEHGRRLVKDALAISYGENADVIGISARSTPESEAGDQVFVHARKYELEPLSEWDATGLRGTCSRAFRISLDIDEDFVYPVPFAVIASAGGLQAHLMFLSAAWLGVAEAAAAKAHQFVRDLRRASGSTPPAANRLAALSVDLDRLRGLRLAAVQRIEQVDGTPEFESLSTLAMLRNLKVGSSRGGAEIVQSALEICGIAGYKRDTPYSLDRHLRDSLGGLVMGGNDRMLAGNASGLSVRKQL